MSPRARLFTALLGGLLVATGTGCGGEPPPPHVLLVTVDSLRPDRLSCYGYREHETPHIDRLAAEGTLFELAVADTPWTTPSMASVMTGTYPPLHGLRSTHVHRLAEERVTLAEILRAYGYATTAFVGSFPLDSIYQLDQGFAHYDDEFTDPIWIFPDHRPEPTESRFLEDPEEQALFTLTKIANDSRREDADVTDAALAWLRERLEPADEDDPEAAEEKARPFFVWVHYFGPHGQPDWRVSAEERERRQIESYDPSVRASDREVGRLLDFLDRQDLADDTLVVLHADHGESLGEERYVGHGWLLNEASLRIPLVVRLPSAVHAGGRVPHLARNVDILPTVLGAVGIERPDGLSGHSLLPWIESRRPGFPGEASGAARRTAYLETWYGAHGAYARPVELPGGDAVKVGTVRRGIRTERWKYVRTEPHALLDETRETAIPASVRRRVLHERLHDLEADTGDAFNVIGIHPDVSRRLRAELAAVGPAEEAGGDGEGAGSGLRLGKEMKARLQAIDAL